MAKFVQVGTPTHTHFQTVSNIFKISKNQSHVYFQQVRLLFFSRDSLRRPWNMPASRNTLLFCVLSTWVEPVTS